MQRPSLPISVIVKADSKVVQELCAISNDKTKYDTLVTPKQSPWPAKLVWLVQYHKHILIKDTLTIM